MNVLINSITDKYSDEWIGKLLSNFDLKNCIVIVGGMLSASQGEDSFRYATLTLDRQRLEHCDYSNVREIISKSSPVDENLLESIVKYEKQVFWMMERSTSVEYNHRWSDYIQHLRFWNYVLDSYNIDVFITPDTPHEVYDYIIYILCKVKGIKVVSGFPLAYYNRFYTFSDIYNPLPDFVKEYNWLLKKYENVATDDIVLRADISEMYDFYTGSVDRTPYYMKDSALVFNSKIVKYLYDNFAIARYIIRIKRYDASLPLTRYIWIFLYRIFFAMNIIIKLFSFSDSTYKWFEERVYRTRVFHEDDIALVYYKKNTVKVDYEKKYVYVALHMQPESTSSPSGGIFVDQALMIEMLSHYLPSQWIIYVKEHPAQSKFGFYKKSSYRTMRFYERLKTCPNVEFVPLEEDTYKLISNSKVVATLTGTVGIEAITQGIPCMMFGFSYMQYAPNVYHIRNNEDCIKAFEKIDRDELIDKDYYKKLKIYFKGLEKYVFKGTTQYMLLNEEERQDSQENLVRYFKNKIISCNINRA